MFYETILDDVLLDGRALTSDSTCHIFINFISNFFSYSIRNHWTHWTQSRGPCIESVLSLITREAEAGLELD